jgi:hypothetical protein
LKTDHGFDKVTRDDHRGDRRRTSIECQQKQPFVLMGLIQLIAAIYQAQILRVEVAQ